MLRPQRTSKRSLNYAHLSTTGHEEHEPKTLPAKNLVKKYTLKRDRALGNKLSAADRPHLLEMRQTGGGLFILCQLGYYECLRHALLDTEGYMFNCPSFVVQENLSHIDDSGAVEVHVIKLNKRGTNNKKFCTINLYNTH